ncbi:large ribosomal subunit protein uL3-like [Saccostrea cucullata]|uniref:large ribosomal subunit protein uL3-like n=1 Tax=Saccostrea cuccullata TaxID=36930 RepID=UPI002ED04CA4
MASLICKLSGSVCLQGLLLKETTCCSRILVNHEQKRYRKRTRKPAPWFVTRKSAPRTYGITEENLTDLQEKVWEDVANMKTSPIREEYLEKKGLTDNMLASLQQNAGEDFQWKYDTFTKQYNHLFLEAGVAPKRKLTRFLISPECRIAPGTRLRADHFRVDDYVDCSAKTIGHAFQGVVKRWGFKGQSASHRGGKNWRKAGAMGGGRSQAGVRPGKKMPGHMGMDWNTQRGLKIVRMDTKYDVIYVKGIVPGPDHCYVRVMDTSLRNRRHEMMKNPPICPTRFEESAKELPSEIISKDLYDFRDPTISFDKE